MPGEVTFSGLKAAFACEAHPVWPSTGPFMLSGLGSEDVDPQRGSGTHRRRGERGGRRRRWKMPA